MEIYDTEEEQVEALKRWWKANGTSTIAGIVTALVLITGWNLWRSHQRDTANQASAYFQQLLTDSGEKKHESVEQMSQQINAQAGSTLYADMSKLFVAKTKVEQGDSEAAKMILQGLMNSSSNDEVKNIARIRLVRLMLATQEYEKGLQTIAQVDASKSDGFSATYDELTGDLYVALGRLGEARTAYQNAKRNGAVSPLLAIKIDDITAAEIEDISEAAE